MYRERVGPASCPVCLVWASEYLRGGLDPVSGAVAYRLPGINLSVIR